MPGIYRKKKRNAGPSKNEEKVERARQAERVQVLGARFPDVQSMTVKLAFAGAQGQNLGEETRTFKGNDPCDFAVPCPGRCGVGSFDLAGKVAAIVAAHESESRCSGVCQEMVFSAPCQCKLDCVIAVAYR